MPGGLKNEDCELSIVTVGNKTYSLEEYLAMLFDSAKENSSWLEDEYSHPPVDHKYLAAKRAFDVTASAAGIIALSPLLVATAFAIKMTSEGPVIFKQERYGKDNIPFTCYKFRSMKIDVPSDIPTSVMNENPLAMTPIGGFLRKTSIDELPQLFNVLKGDMSIIGPRPMILAEKDQIVEREKYNATSIKPGISGWAQVNGRDGLTIEEKARYDGEYRDKMSLMFDAKIVLRSLGVVASRDGYGDGCSSRRRITDVGKPMRLLVVTQHYWPEPFNFADICEGLVQRGYDVTVLTGLPNYPEGSIYSGYEQGQNRKQMHNGVKIFRAPLIPRGHNPIQRVMNYYSFPIAATKEAEKLGVGFDAVISLQSSPVMQTRAAINIANRIDAPLLHYVIDIWPECLRTGGIGTDNPVYQHYRRVSKDIYEQADRLAVTSPKFKSYLEDLMGHEVHCFDLPQYAEDIFIDSADLVRPGGYLEEKVNYTFAGNIGSAQSVDTIICAAAMLRNDDRFIFHIVGSGSELENCEKLAEELEATNVVFHGRHDISEMPSFYAASDAMIATFTDTPILGLTLPRKIQSYMAAGRPVIAASLGETERVISESRCGACCAAEDAEALAIECLRFAYIDPVERELMGRRGREYYNAHYSRDKFFDTLDGELNKLRGSRHGK